MKTADIASQSVQLFTEGQGELEPSLQRTVKSFSWIQCLQSFAQRLSQDGGALPGKRTCVKPSLCSWQTQAEQEAYSPILPYSPDPCPFLLMLFSTTQKANGILSCQRELVQYLLCISPSGPTFLAKITNTLDFMKWLLIRICTLSPSELSQTTPD